MTTLATRFPDLIGGGWAISAGKTHPGEVTASGRLPTSDEISLWAQLNADQSIAHVDAMRINGPTSGPVWISEKTEY